MKDVYSDRFIPCRMDAVSRSLFGMRNDLTTGESGSRGGTATTTSNMEEEADFAESQEQQRKYAQMIQQSLIFSSPGATKSSQGASNGGCGGVGGVGGGLGSGGLGSGGMGSGSGMKASGSELCRYHHHSSGTINSTSVCTCQGSSHYLDEQHSSQPSILRFKSPIAERRLTGDLGQFVPLFGNAIGAMEATLSTKRAIAKTPVKVLDAPGLYDDFYIDVLDWSGTSN